MATQTLTKPQQDQSVEKKIQQFRELFADAPELGKKALENALHELRSQASDPPPPVESAGRVGARLGKVSELTIIVPLAPGGAQAVARVPAGCWGAISRKARTRSAPSTPCASCSSTTTRGCSSPRPMTATGTPISTTSWRKFPTIWTSSIPPGTAGPAFASGSEGLPRQAPDHGGRLVRRLSGSDGGGDPAAAAHRQGGGRIPRQGRLSQRIHATVEQDGKEKQPWLRKQQQRIGQNRTWPSSRRFRSCGSFTPTRREYGENGAGERAPSADVAGVGGAGI